MIRQLRPTLGIRIRIIMVGNTTRYIIITLDDRPSFESFVPLAIFVNSIDVILKYSKMLMIVPLNTLSSISTNIYIVWL